MTVTFGGGAGRMTSGAIYANTGTAVCGDVPFGFYDVGDVAGLTAAMREARG